MKSIKDYHGVFPAFYACYDEEGSICPVRIAEFTKYLINKGIKGVYVGGSSGECIYHNVEERKLVLECVVKAAEDKLLIIAHVAASNTKDSMELAAHAESLGVRAISAIPPIYYRLPEQGVLDYWRDIASAAPNTDFIAYNIPQLSGVTVTPDMYKKALEIPTVVGIKNTSMPAVDMQVFKNVGGDETVVFNGPDEQFLAGRVMGADGGIGGTYAVMPELFLKLDETIKNSDLQKAAQIQKDIIEIIDILASCGSLYAVAKAVLVKQGIDIGKVRAPLMNLKPEHSTVVDNCAEKIEKAIKKYC